MDVKFLTEIRNIAENFRKEVSYPKLYSIVNVHLLRVDKISFDVSCEGLFTVLYFGLLQETPTVGVIQTVCGYFISKWFGECETNDLNKFIGVEKSKKIVSYGAAILLYNHYFPCKDASQLEEILNWADIQSPHWLKLAVSSNELPFSNLNIILLASLSFDKVELPISIFSTVISNDFIKLFLNFFDACRKYQNNCYEDSLKNLTLSEANCEDLCGWACLIAGLNLEHLGRYNSAVLKYREALNYSIKCLPALHFSSRVFKKLNSTSNQLQSLYLLTEAEVVKWNEDLCIQSLLMNFHIPVEVDICERALWLLSSTCLSLQKWEEAKGHYVTLQTKYKDSCERSLNTSNARSLLLKEDRLPHLPSMQCIKLEYVLSLMWLKEYEEAEIALMSASLNDVNLKKIEESNDAEKLDKIAGLMLEILKAEVCYERFNFNDALSICTRVLMETEDISGLPLNLWTDQLLLVKAFLYKLLSNLNNSEVQKENKNHFSRLHKQCYNSCDPQRRNETTPDECCKMILGNMNMYIREKCK